MLIDFKRPLLDYEGKPVTTGNGDEGAALAFGQWLAPVVARFDGFAEGERARAFVLPRYVNDARSDTELDSGDVALLCRIVRESPVITAGWVRRAALYLLDPSTIKDAEERAVLERVYGAGRDGNGGGHEAAAAPGKARQKR